MLRRALLSQLAAASAYAALPFPALATETPAEGWIERMAPSMGSFTRIAIASTNAESGHQIISRCFDTMESVAQELSNYRWDSATVRLNREHRLLLSDASPHFWKLWQIALHLRHATRGYFDPLASPLLSLWRAAQTKSSVPQPADIRAALRLQTTTRVKLDQRELHLESGGLEVGGIGKGFVADTGAELLQQLGVTAGRIGCGGDLRFIGKGPWEVEIVHPRDSGPLGTLRLSGACAVSTSGDYENCWQVGGQLFHHLIDPWVGTPCYHTQQVTVVAPRGAHADAIATALFLMPPALRKDFAKLALFSYALIVDAHGAFHELRPIPSQVPAFIAHNTTSAAL